ncbi:uncharacterized protein LY89DRAFT_674124 [Mollisia scopiformis]|uniref:Uncharacterized protein n=1 Tax=Mollisia scopiformis TaxID=149040 RepID=A0A194WUA6_MOLSC|nr:uncharacterized protein LY89DRAFT_674124 [Mollisia scopiformis]KUJ11541.1 hypothetical protein LY89DRAFT_674124 [Mollisia scopiformis]
MNILKPLLIITVPTPTPVTHFIDVEMENVLNPPCTMMFAPVPFGLNPGQTSVITEDVTSIGLIGVPNPAMTGPYLPTDETTVQDVYGMWLGPTPEAGGFSIEFNIVGPYPPAEGEDRASKAAATDTKTKSVKWKRVDFKALSLSELNCAERQLNEAKETFQDNDEASKLIKSWLDEVADEKKKYEPKEESKGSS